MRVLYPSTTSLGAGWLSGGGVLGSVGGWAPSLFPTPQMPATSPPRGDNQKFSRHSQLHPGERSENHCILEWSFLTRWELVLQNAVVNPGAGKQMQVTADFKAQNCVLYVHWKTHLKDWILTCVCITQVQILMLCYLSVSGVCELTGSCPL